MREVRAPPTATPPPPAINTAPPRMARSHSQYPDAPGVSKHQAISILIYREAHECLPVISWATSRGGGDGDRRFKYSNCLCDLASSRERLRFTCCATSTVTRAVEVRKPSLRIESFIICRSHVGKNRRCHPRWSWQSCLTLVAMFVSVDLASGTAAPGEYSPCRAQSHNATARK